MKHLHQKFKEELGEAENLYVKNGLVYIRERYWSPSDIVELAGARDGTNEVFDQLFANWLEERTDDLLQMADEILDRYDQRDRFRRLSEAYDTGAVVPFVGAGFSMPSGYPGWTTFLRRQRKETAILEEEFEHLLKEGKYEEAAQRIADLMDVAFNEAVDSSFGCTRELTGVVQLLPYIFKGSVITTNFDNVLSRSFASAGNQFVETFSGCDSQEIRRKLANDEHFLLMLHGKAPSGRGRILTFSEYEEHYANGRTLQKTIASFCDTHNLLFLGCSLTVDRTLAAIRDYVNEEGHDRLPKHYAFLAEPDSNEKRLERQRELARCHIYPIWYPAGTHDESIEALLTKLSNGAAQ
ncbi:SIR2 family protein [Paraburkholderia sp. BR10936]|uniref:SIR2 family protein n=1 Tax=Paraburkholderia sp. BR10936 TaxID=3236993 RepID=UPI0034D161FB